MQEDTFRWVITGAVVISTLLIFIMAAVSVALYRIASNLKAKVDGITARVEPLIDTAKTLARENSPKISDIATRAREIADNTKNISDVAKVKVGPILDTAKALASENAPKISGVVTRVQEIADNAKDISVVARDQAHRFAEVGRDIADRTKAQVAKVDTAVEETMTHAQHVGEGVKQAVMRPVREATGVVAGIKAAVSSYAAGRRTSVDHIAQDEEMFI